MPVRFLAHAADPLGMLTGEEREVLALLAEGHPNDRIAAQLTVTARTVETHMSRIVTKLGFAPDPGTHRRVLACSRTSGRPARPGAGPSPHRPC